MPQPELSSAGHWLSDVRTKTWRLLNWGHGTLYSGAILMLCGDVAPWYLVLAEVSLTLLTEDIACVLDSSTTTSNMGGQRETGNSYHNPVQLLSEKTPAGRGWLHVDKPAPVLIVLPRPNLSSEQERGLPAQSSCQRPSEMST